ncbi:hypothetical protein GALMADRAFT_766544 [Galerina marginata CBS 339.88]|uniref:Uncharacterized protein n=1 Tax=Galerina marginata (strain CBS 339.88) TaxID=685588 RepID=A0A067SZN5_GALM3|nr:hypothetical protein GALMADRAFT_766544 [Galerina marginata CBS 339.88]
MADVSYSNIAAGSIAEAVKGVEAAPPREDDNDNETIRGHNQDSNIDTSIFDSFTDFELDLSCLSPPASPAASTSELPLTASSAPSSPILARSISYASQLTISTKKSPTKQASSPKLSATAPAGTRGSWPLVKYAGRGTPIDRNRRLEWGGFSGEDVAEDGILFSAVRSTSLDSATRPSQRSLSPEWNFSSALSSSHSHSGHSHTSQKDSSSYEQPPELAPLQLDGMDADKRNEWDSIMKTVLSPTVDSPEAPEIVEKPRPQLHTAVLADNTLVTGPPMMSPEQIEQLNSGLEIDLGLNAALDLGLGQRGGMNWFDLGLLPTSASGRGSPSIYSSQAQTPHASPPASVHASEHRSTTSTKAELEVANNSKSEAPRWWRRMMDRLRRVHTLITIHKERF